MTGIAIFFISDKNAKLPWYTDFIASAKRSDGPAFYVPVAKLVASLPIGYYAGVFLLLSAIDHILVCLPGFNGIYNRYLCINQVLASSHNTSDESSLQCYDEAIIQSLPSFYSCTTRLTPLYLSNLYICLWNFLTNILITDKIDPDFSSILAYRTSSAGWSTASPPL